MSSNSVFSIKKLVEDLHNAFDDIDISKIDYQYFKIEMQTFLNESKSIENLLLKICKHLRMQQDKNLMESREAIKGLMQKMKHPKSLTQIGEFKISDSVWKFNSGQLFLLSSFEDLSSEIYRHVVFDMAIKQNLQVLNFISKPKHEKILNDIIVNSNKRFNESQLSHDPDMVKIKQCQSVNHYAYHMDRHDFENHLKYLLHKYPSQVVYLDESQLLALKNESEDLKKSYQNLGEFLLRIANIYNVTFILRIQLQEKVNLKVSELPYHIGNLLNYCEHCVHFRFLEDTKEDMGYSLYDLYNLKQYPIESQTIFFNEETNSFQDFEE